MLVAYRQSSTTESLSNAHMRTWTNQSVFVCCYLQLVRFPTPRRQDRHDRSGDGKKKGRKSKHKPHLEMPVGAPIFKKRKADEVITDDGDDESITDVRREGVVRSVREGGERVRE